MATVIEARPRTTVQKHTRAVVSLPRLRHNLACIRQAVGPDAHIIAVVKADAYGHGSVCLARELLRAGTGSLAVAFPCEALELRRAFPAARILVMGCHLPEDLQPLVDHDIATTVCTMEQAEELNVLGSRAGRKARVHVKVDTGMGRIGFRASGIYGVMRQLVAYEWLDIEGIYTHFPSSDEQDKSFSLKQIEAFNWIVEFLGREGIRIPLRHVANSAAICDLPGSRFNAVRPGISLYGLHPSDELANVLDLKPIMQLKTRIVFLKEVPPGAPLSYGRTFVTTRRSRIATLPIGYADGYSRRLSNKGMVEVCGKMAPVVGRVCMDMTLIDVTDVPEAALGTDVTLYGDCREKPNSVESVAKVIDTIPYEVTCNIAKRVPRVYEN